MRLAYSFPVVTTRLAALITASPIRPGKPLSRRFAESYSPTTLGILYLSDWFLSILWWFPFAFCTQNGNKLMYI